MDARRFFIVPSGHDMPCGSALPTIAAHLLELCAHAGRELDSPSKARLYGNEIGSDGVLIVDTQFAPQAQKLMTEIRKLNQGPVLFIVNTHFIRIMSEATPLWRE